MQDTSENRTYLAHRVATLWAAFPSAKPFDPVMAKAYWFGLNDLDQETIDRAITLAMRQCKFFPTIAELRELAGESPHQRAIQAWDALQRQVGALYSGRIVFDDQAITATVRHLGGPKRVYYAMSTEDAKWLRKEFLEAYPGFATRDGGNEQPLIGVTDGGDKRIHLVRTGLSWAPAKVALPGVERADPSIPLPSFDLPT